MSCSNHATCSVKPILKSEFILQQVEEAISTVTDNQRSMESGFEEASNQVKDRAQQLIEKIKKWEEYNLQKLQDTKQQQDQPCTEKDPGNV